MPVKRDKYGNVVEVPTRVTDRGGGEPVQRAVDRAATGQLTRVYRKGSADAKTPVAPGDGSRYGVPTKLMDNPPGRDSGATVVVGGTGTPGPRGPMSDPPVGWLVVVEGPGKGSVATLRIGSNTIGRDPGANRVAINHGDRMMSRRNHGTIIYDDRNRAFWIRDGDGKNLTYVGDEPVVEARRLNPFTHIRMGETVLRFVPLCGESFAWTNPKGGD